MPQHNKQRQVKHPPKRFDGIIRVAAKGVGYVAHEAALEDIEIPAEFLNTALNGDAVSVALLSHIHGQRQQGEVLEVRKRAKEEFVGVVDEDANGCFVAPDDKKMYIDILLLPPETRKVRHGEKVLVRLKEWSDPKKNPVGTVEKVLGKKGEHEVEMESIVLSHGFTIGFPSDVESEARGLKKDGAIAEEDARKRRDMRGITTVTIDPIDAKDFDDALSIQKLSDTRWEVGVHIADVSYYVRPGTALDKEAARRGTSIYLVDRTIPMLPEVLSNDLCSLNPLEDKRTYSAIFTVDKDGSVHERWFGRTLTRSCKRFSYEDAQKVLDAKRGDYNEELQGLNTIAKKIKEKRHREGAIEFEEDEVRFELDPSGKPLSVHRKERLDTHKLVEEWMLLANREVAECVGRLEKKGGKDKPFVYRVHDVPNPDKIEELSIFLKAIGHELVVADGAVSGKDLNALFRQIEGEAAEGLVKTAAIRAMAKALYTIGNIGHFGLAFKYYTHFTSPIRRYPDIMVHRLLTYYLAGKDAPHEELERYHALAAESSKREIEATEAERASIKYKQVEYLQGHVGKEFDGVVSGVTDWGIYVEEKGTKAEGMVRVRDLGDDYYELDRKNYALVGTRTKKTFSLGEKVRVKLVRADLDARTLDFVLT